MTFKKLTNGFLEVIFRMFLLIGGFLSLDLIYHKIYETNFNLYQVPPEYYLNKVLWGIPLAVIAYYVVNYLFKFNKYSYKKNFIFVLIIIIPLQIRYYLTGHFTPIQNIVVLIAHYFMIELLLISYYWVYDMDYIG